MHVDTRRRRTTDDMATGNGGVMTPGSAESDMPRNPQLGSEIGDCFGEKGETNFVLTSGAVQSYENIWQCLSIGSIGQSGPSPCIPFRRRKLVAWDSFSILQFTLCHPYVASSSSNSFSKFKIKILVRKAVAM